MTTLLCLGYGYCAQRFVALHGDGFTRILGSTREAMPSPAGRVELIPAASPALIDAAGRADVLLVSAPPGETGDPFAAKLAQALDRAGSGVIAYLSTIGVYGDSGGGWIDEDNAPPATNPRGRRRLEAEAEWRALGERRQRPVALLRLGGIYGPGRNALEDLRSGKARCIEREEQVFNRIHVDDIANALAAAIKTGFDGAVNVVDDEPSPSCAPVRYAAELLGIAPPAPVPFAEAASAMSPMALSFWQDNRRVRNERLKCRLGVTLRYPDYRAGLAALHQTNRR
ncbi:SDR family oxidoreductase [Ancylobacter sp. 6x-1]|uniref:SDR family oxidoreductase n=1 Tax=Ancylobacter crimeensis TaxID=2579147 RepID=A0ABT0DAD4_9HYPH|nr:SDR family oxidoreductase [Ancylobacter crimeensis]MCK0196902.1 SDR family oxidoreductase [Ancylobacter crimeensis]